MAQPNKDDPMDLGPFIQNWVFNNPFTNIPKPADFTQEEEKQKAPSPPATNLQKEDNPPETAPCETQKESLACQEGTNESGTDDNEGGDNDFIVTEKTGKVIDTPKGHIGSNRTYARMIKTLRLPTEKHEQVRDWILQHYRHDPQFITIREPAGNIISLVHRRFPEINTTVISRILKCTFPDCKKIVTKNGTSYEGLVPKPEKDMNQNQRVITTLQKMKDHSLTVEHGAKMCNLPVKVIAGCLLWSNEAHSYNPADLTNEVFVDDNGVLNELQLPKLEDLQDRSDVESCEKSPSPDINDTWLPANIINEGALSRRKNKPTRRKRSTDVNDNMSENGSSDLRIQPKRRAKGGHFPRINSDNEEDISQESGFSVDDDESEQRLGSSGKMDVDENDIQGVRIKKEPLDDEYRSSVFYSIGSNQDKKQCNVQKTPLTKTNSCRNANSSQEPEDLSKDRHKEKSVNFIHADVTDLLQANMELKKVRATNLELSDKLIKTTEELRKVKAAAKKRDTQVAELGVEFLELSNQFMMVSHRFKALIHEMNVPQQDNGRISNGQNGKC